jgi:hypothetical protein
MSFNNLVEDNINAISCLTLCRSNLNPYCMGRKAAFFSVGIYIFVIASAFRPAGGIQSQYALVR